MLLICIVLVDEALRRENCEMRAGRCEMFEAGALREGGMTVGVCSRSTVSEGTRGKAERFGRVVGAWWSGRLLGVTCV